MPFTEEELSELERDIRSDVCSGCTVTDDDALRLIEEVRRLREDLRKSELGVWEPSNESVYTR